MASASIVANGRRRAIAQTGGRGMSRVFTRHDAILTRLVMGRTVSERIEDGVIAVLKNVSRRPIEPTMTSDLVADLGFDSLQVLEVVAELEDRFDISIPLDDVSTARTVEQVVAQITALVGERTDA